MNISSQTIADLYCDPQFNRMRRMIPADQKQHETITVGQGQQNDPETTGGQVYYTQNTDNNSQQANGINLHGNANTNVKILNKKAAGNSNDCDDDKDNPIDLSSSGKNQNNAENNLQDTINKEIEKRSANKVNKRKLNAIKVPVENLILNDSKWVGHVKPVPGIPRQAGSKREEVLKAARSLFSKRTRTLYHWLCPTTSKTKLKSTVAAAWDTLSSAEKDFYISQVLGRFGVPACSLMVNPQLGGLKTDDKPNTASNTSTASGSSSNIEETHRAVSNLLLNENEPGWSSYSNDETPRKKRKNNPIFKQDSIPGTSTNKEPQKQPEEEETILLKEIREASMEDDFADDPELNTEFEQFRWALHVTNANSPETNKN